MDTESKRYMARDRNRKIIYRQLEKLSDQPMYGWRSGGFLCPLMVAAGEWTIEADDGKGFDR